MPNISTVTEFLLLGFSEVRELQLVHAVLFLLVYLAALTGNLLIVAVTALDWRLHTPMYFFLRNLSVLDLCYISVTVPKSIHNSLTDRSSISFLGCAAQLFSVVLFAASEVFILTAMSYDRYAANCLPLRYEVVMNGRACGTMAAASWLTGGLLAVMCSAATFSLSFCGSNIVPQFFCDIPSLLKISCSTDHVAVDVSVTAGAVLGFPGFILVIFSYVRIFRAVLRMPAAEGRAKAFSTCLPHLAVVTIFISAAAFVYLKPSSESSSIVDLLVSVFYSVVPPVLNPLIYSLRNRDVKAAMDRILKGYEVIMNGQACGTMAAASWLTGGLLAAMRSAGTFSLSFCGFNIVPQFFSTVFVYLKPPSDSYSITDLLASMFYSMISCSKDHVAIDVTVAAGVVLGVTCYILIVVSLKPPSDSFSIMDLLMSVFYSMISCSEDHVVSDVSITGGSVLVVVSLVFIVVSYDHVVIDVTVLCGVALVVIFLVSIIVSESPRK
ncbi:olfactory receptor 14A16-like [Tachyglossus aculeatus]|uniref:olfactory receptor 14A16-like n=1 Tax=Tachyglossus aculeatus TaxID=9261 RepID=UPI0018F5E977|nr:olfactory receptor 14A16-like [Tachyglossus aculeatus]